MNKDPKLGMGTKQGLCVGGVLGQPLGHLHVLVAQVTLSEPAWNLQSTAVQMMGAEGSEMSAMLMMQCGPRLLLVAAVTGELEF